MPWWRWNYNRHQQGSKSWIYKNASLTVQAQSKEVRYTRRLGQCHNGCTLKKG